MSTVSGFYPHLGLPPKSDYFTGKPPISLRELVISLIEQNLQKMGDDIAKANENPFKDELLQQLKEVPAVYPVNYSLVLSDGSNGGGQGIFIDKSRNEKGPPFERGKTSTFSWKIAALVAVVAYGILYSLNISKSKALVISLLAGAVFGQEKVRAQIQPLLSKVTLGVRDFFQPANFRR